MAQHLAEQQLRAEQARARHAALHDPVTELPNRSLFTDRLSQILSKAGRHKHFAVCVIGLDNFAAITDALGHRVGDRLLAAVGARLAGVAAEHDCLLARLDGAEFGLLVEDTICAEDAAKLTDRLLSLLDVAFNIDDQDLSVRSSAGILERPAAGSSPADALRSAHSALHWSQQDGGGRWTIFDDERNAAQLARYRISAAIPGTLAGRRFSVEYQPIVDLDTGRIAGVEALARWHHPQLGTVPPSVFIPLASQAGFVVDLGRHMLEQACQDAATWWSSTPQAPFVSVNVAAQQLHELGFVGEIATILDRTGLPPQQLQLEITETVAVDTNAHVIAALHALANLRVRLAIDDFGTGYANHACLGRLPVHALKLDATFAEAFGVPATDGRAAAIMANLIDLGHTLGLSVTAEGVTTALAPRLRDMRCDHGQGFELGRPAPATQMHPPASV
jgi:diguanylate cyclase (GGDEF)-like protein